MLPSVAQPDIRQRCYEVAQSNLEHAIGLPGSERLDVAYCLRWLDDAARLIRQKTERHLYRLKEEPEEYDHSEANFRMNWLVTVLQRDLGVRYRTDLVEASDHEFLKRSDHLFIHGIIQGQGGTCSSMPILYAAVGRRLGYPLYVVSCKRHWFVRWEGRGERLNVEATSQGFVSYCDDYYNQWPEPTDKEEVKRYGYLRNQSGEEERANFKGMRGHVFLENGRFWEAITEYIASYAECPGREVFFNPLCVAVNRWGAHLKTRIGVGFPEIVLAPSPVRHLHFPTALSGDINYYNAVESLLESPELQRKWWGPLRRDGRRPVGMPRKLLITYLDPIPGYRELGMIRYEGIE